MTSAPSANVSSPVHTSTGICTTRKKVLAALLLVQVFVMAVMQWKFGGILGIVSWEGAANNSPSYVRTLVKPVDFLGADIHKEHPEFCHTWEEEHEVDITINAKDVAIGMGITSAKLYKKKELSVWPFFKQLLPSFCKTASKGYNYHFFLAYDYTDKYFTNSETLDQFTKKFMDYTKGNCPQSSVYLIHFIQCSHHGKPANAQNDAMMAAYMLNMAYFYRINDDTVMSTGGWTEIFIKRLFKYSPNDVGVVGPKHKNGNTNILTYDFVSWHHVGIFGCYYPHVSTDWWGDSWISEVYKPGRVTKVKKLQIVHLYITPLYTVEKRICKSIFAQYVEK